MSEGRAWALERAGGRPVCPVGVGQGDFQGAHDARTLQGSAVPCHPAERGGQVAWRQDERRVPVVAAMAWRRATPALWDPGTGTHSAAP